MVEGLWPTFEAILLAQVIWGLGATFMSGATQAWISDEIGEPAAARAFLRGAQVTSFCTLLAIPVSVALAGYQLNVPILAGAALMLGLGLVLAAVMPETGFQPRRPEPAISPLRSALATLHDGVRVARGSSLVVALLLLAAVFGMASEGFDRLWTPLVLQNFEFPSILGLDQIAWFGVMRGGAMLLAIGGMELVRRWLDLTDSRAVALALLACDALRIASVLVFAFAGEFVLALLAFWLTSVLRRVTQPILLAWLNQQLESRTRATVLSIGRPGRRPRTDRGRSAHRWHRQRVLARCHRRHRAVPGAGARALRAHLAQRAALAASPHPSRGARRPLPEGEARTPERAPSPSGRGSASSARRVRAALGVPLPAMPSSSIQLGESVPRRHGLGGRPRRGSLVELLVDFVVGRKRLDFVHDGSAAAGRAAELLAAGRGEPPACCPRRSKRGEGRWTTNQRALAGVLGRQRPNQPAQDATAHQTAHVGLYPFLAFPAIAII